MHFVQRVLAVVGVDEHAVGQHLLTAADAVDVGRPGFVRAGRIAQFEHLAR